MSIRERIEEEIQRLEQLRDELNVQAHLAQADASDEIREVWQKAEHEMAHLKAELKRISKGAEQPLEEIGQATELLVDEIKSGYRKIRDLL